MNSGFILNSSKIDTWDDKQSVKRINNFTNEHCNLLFQKRQDRSVKELAIYKEDIMGMLFRTFTEIDLKQLLSVYEAIDTD